MGLALSLFVLRNDADIPLRERLIITAGLMVVTGLLGLFRGWSYGYEMDLARRVLDAERRANEHRG